MNWMIKQVPEEKLGTALQASYSAASAIDLHCECCRFTAAEIVRTLSNNVLNAVEDYLPAIDIDRRRVVYETSGGLNFGFLMPKRGELPLYTVGFEAHTAGLRRDLLAAGFVPCSVGLKDVTFENFGDAVTTPSWIRGGFDFAIVGEGLYIPTFSERWGCWSDLWQPYWAPKKSIPEVFETSGIMFKGQKRLADATWQIVNAERLCVGAFDFTNACELYLIKGGEIKIKEGAR